MNNSALWSTTSSIANGLWLQVMKLVRGPVLIFPHFLSSQCKWRGINLKYWFAGLSEVLSGHSHSPHPPFPMCSSFFSHLPVRKSCLCSIFSFLGRYAQNRMRKRFTLESDTRKSLRSCPTLPEPDTPAQVMAAVGNTYCRLAIPGSPGILPLPSWGNECYSLNEVEECPKQAVGYSV